MKSKATQFIKKSTEKTKFIYLLTVLVSGVQSALMVFFALSTKDLINSALSDSSELKTVLFRAGISIILLIFAFLFSVLDKIMIEKCRLTCEVNLKKEVFSKLLNKDYAKISEYKTGDLVGRITTDSQIIARGYSQILPAFVAMIVKVVLAVGVLLYYQPIFTLFLVFGGLVIVGASFLVRKLFKKLHRKTREKESEAVSYLTENTSNLLAVKVFSVEYKVSSLGSKKFDEYLKTAKKQRYIASLLTSALSFAFSFFYIATVVWGAINLLNGSSGVTFGLITAMIQLVNQLQAPFMNFTQIFTVYYEMLSSAERILEVIDIKDEQKSSEDDRINYSDIRSISAKNLTFSYGREKVIDNASFEIKKGDFCLIKGISGIGKSTLFKLLLGVYDDYQGELYFETENSKKKITSSDRSLFAFVPQGNMLFSGTIRENVCFLNDSATEEEIMAAAEISCMDFLDSLPQGLDTVIGENGQGLSEGQGQRVAICRALLSKKPIILLDEATSALDEETEIKVLKSIKEKLGNDTTLIIISHKMVAKDICNVQMTIKDRCVELKRY